MKRRDSFRPLSRGCLAAVVGLGLGLIIGCGEAPAVSSSDEQATIKGVVTFEGKPVRKGTITFDPSNVNRRMAMAKSAPINEDGTYSITSLVGRNMISFDLPGIGTPKNKLNYSRTSLEVKAVENAFNVELPIP